MSTALVRSVFVVRVVEGLLFLRKLFVVLAVIASAVFLSPALGLLLGIVALFMWSGGAGVARAFGVTADAKLAVEGEELVVTGPKVPRRIPLSAMRSGRVTPDGNGSRAHVVVRGRAGVVLDADLTRREARGLLRDLGLSAREQPMTFSFFFGMRVTVGADGILVAWPLLRRRRFVRYADIVDVKATTGRIVVLLRDHSRYDIATASSEKSSNIDEHYALVERIEDAREAHGEDGESGATLAAALARGGRSARAWVKDLAAMAEAGGTGYRASALPRETLWRIVLDPNETEELRIGASLTLRTELDDEGRARLRSAAEASASPRVRVALSGAADALDDEALGDAIAGRARARRD
jgi:hypothetical protein